MTHKEKALKLFNEKNLCSQAVLASFAEECGLTEEQALKVSACFGTGMRQGEVCGACTGALMVLGCLYGEHGTGDLEKCVRANEVNDEMMRRFAEKSGSYICNDLLGCDVRTEEGIKYAQEQKLFTDFCPKMVANAVDIIEEMIEEREGHGK